MDRLRVLHAVSQHGSISGAAEALHVTSSAASQQLGKLTREVGQPLVQRHGRGIRLTDTGELLVQRAATLLSMVAETEADLEAHRGAVLGTVRIGGFATAARGLMPAALAALRDEHPQLRVQLSELEPEYSLSQVDRGDIDVAIVQDWFNAPLCLPHGMVTSPLANDVADIALAANHPLAGRESLHLEELADEEFISSTQGTFCHDWLLYTLRQRELEPRISHTAAEYPTQLALVAAGCGAAVIPRLGRKNPEPGVCFVPVTPAFTRHIYAVSRRESATRPALLAVLRALSAAGTEHDASSAPAHADRSPASAAASPAAAAHRRRYPAPRG